MLHLEARYFEHNDLATASRFINQVVDTLANPPFCIYFKIMHYITHKLMQLLNLCYFFWQISTRNIEFVPLSAISFESHST
jgi:hypothetical protein